MSFTGFVDRGVPSSTAVPPAVNTVVPGNLVVNGLTSGTISGTSVQCINIFATSATTPAGASNVVRVGVSGPTGADQGGTLALVGTKAGSETTYEIKTDTANGLLAIANADFSATVPMLQFDGTLPGGVATFGSAVTFQQPIVNDTTFAGVVDITSGGYLSVSNGTNPTTDYYGFIDMPAGNSMVISCQTVDGTTAVGNVTVVGLASTTLPGIVLNVSAPGVAGSVRVTGNLECLGDAEVTGVIKAPVGSPSTYQYYGISGQVGPGNVGTQPLFDFALPTVFGSTTPSTVPCPPGLYVCNIQCRFGPSTTANLPPALPGDNNISFVFMVYWTGSYVLKSGMGPYAGGDNWTLGNINDWNLTVNWPTQIYVNQSTTGGNATSAVLTVTRVFAPV